MLWHGNEGNTFSIFKRWRKSDADAPAYADHGKEGGFGREVGGNGFKWRPRAYTRVVVCVCACGCTEEEEKATASLLSCENTSNFIDCAIARVASERGLGWN